MSQAHDTTKKTICQHLNEAEREAAEAKKELDDYRQLCKASNFQPNTFNSIFLNAGMTVYSISLLKKVY